MRSPFDHKSNAYILTHDNFDHTRNADDDTFTKRLRYECGRFINNEHTQRFISFLIVLNSIALGIGTFDFVTNNNHATIIFETMDMVCLTLFTVEIVMQFIHHGFKMFKDPWLVFDFSVIAMSWMAESLDVSRAFRIIRAFRLIVRMHDLRDLVEALTRCTQRIFAVGLLLVLIMYVFGVMFTSSFKDLYEQGYLDEDYFSRLDKTIFTLFQMMTMDNWTSIIKQVMVVYPWAWCPFILYILLSTFLVLNLAVGVICGAVADVKHEELEMQVRQVSSEFGDRNEVTIRSLERKIEDLTLMIETMAQGAVIVQQRQPTLQSTQSSD